MKIFAFLINFALCHPTKTSCIATCTGETADWSTYSSNGVKTKGKKFRQEIINQKYNKF